MSEQGPNAIYDNELNGTWYGPPEQPARPWDIGGRNEDGSYRIGTTFLERESTTLPGALAEPGDDEHTSTA